MIVAKSGWFIATKWFKWTQVFWDESNWSCLGRSSTAGDNTLLVVPSVKKPPFKAKTLNLWQFLIAKITILKQVNIGTSSKYVGHRP
jgi:hypothetical protein